MFPLLLLLFLASGCAALIYEVVWLPLLQLIIGSSAVSLAVLLGAYMGGLCLGSLLLPRWVAARHHPLRVFGLIECGIGVLGLLVLVLVPRLETLYIGFSAAAAPGLAARIVLAAVCLVPPTVLMGASLPAISRYVEGSGGAARLGYLYAANIAGAVLGALIAGFYLLRLFDMAVASYAAAAINFIAGLAAFALAARTRHPAAVAPGGASLPGAAAQPPAEGAAVLAGIALSGFTALGAEVLWTRMLSLMLGATVYTFSIILAVFLAGLGLGSAAGSFLSRRVRADLALAACQLLLVYAMTWAAYAAAALVPSPDFYPAQYLRPRDMFTADLVRVVWVVLPAALLWGASFPLALAALRGRSGDAAVAVSRVYAANTLGGIAGALLTTLLIPDIGTRHAQQLLIAVSAIAGLAVLLPRLRWKRDYPALAAGAAMVILGMFSVQPLPWRAIAFGRHMNAAPLGTAEYVGEGLNSTIAVSSYAGGVHYFHVSGKVEASSEAKDMRLQRMLGHLSALLADRPEDVLVVGFGAGVTAGSFTLYPEVKSITIDELEPLVPPASTRWFGAQNYHVLEDPRTTVHYDDARQFVLTTQRKFDVITSDPIHPWVKGMAALYSREYFELCKRRLKPGGVVTQWIPLYENDGETIRSELATFFEAFPHATLWNSDADGRGYDLVAVGRQDDAPIDVAALDAKLRSPRYAAVAASLHDVGLTGMPDILATYAGRAEDLAPWLAGAVVNTDLNMRLQYLAGWSLNFNHPGLIYAKIVSYRGFPAGRFRGSEEQVRPLRELAAAAAAPRPRACAAPLLGLAAPC